MDWFSIVILVVLGFYAIGGLRAGLIRQVIGLFGIIVALVLAFRHFEAVGRAIAGYVAMDMALANVAGFSAIVIGVLLAASIIGHLWSRLARLAPISLLDSIGGAAFGLLKGLILVSIVLILLSALPFAGVRAAIDGSTVASGLLSIAPTFYARIERSLPADVPRLMISPEGIRLRRIDFSSLDGAKCVACGGRVRFTGIVRKGYANVPKFVCSRCGRTSDGCQTYQGFHLIYGECPVERAREGFRIDCKVWPNNRFVLPQGPCPVCGATLGRRTRS
ncbi:MAG TPA: CvpA family protein [Firmicutes bacterium]|nr:CvpA family protein [Bacillota bacterium]